MNISMSFKVNPCESEKTSGNITESPVNMSTGMGLSVSPSESMSMSLIIGDWTQSGWPLVSKYRTTKKMIKECLI